MEAGVAAERLNLSPSGLRRVAAIYETVHGLLPRKSGRKAQRGPRARLYSAEAVERLAAAQSFVTAGRYTSIEEGLRAYERGERPDIDAEPVGELIPRAKAVQDELTGVLRRVLQDELRQRDAGIEERLTTIIEARFAELRQELAEVKRLPREAAPKEPRPQAREPGLLVRAAIWIESVLKR